MCVGCWEDYGFPLIRNERVIAALPLIDAVYEHSCVGGNLHIQLDDWNIEDERFAGEMRVYDDNAGPEQLAAERACYAAFASMTEDERASALAIRDKFDEIEGIRPAPSAQASA